MVGTVRLRLIYFHLSSFGITLWQSFTVLLMSRCNFLVMFVARHMKLLLSLKLSILLFYSLVYITIIEFPLSAILIMALPSISFFFIRFMVLLSCIAVSMRTVCLLLCCL